VGITKIQAAASRADIGRFIRYPFTRYRDYLHWVPPLLITEREQFDPHKNPFYDHARVNLLLAERDGEVVGRVAAIDDDNHNETHGDNLLFFGFFEAEDEEAAEALFSRVEERARELGREAVRGPVNPSMNHSADGASPSGRARLCAQQPAYRPAMAQESVSASGAEREVTSVAREERNDYVDYARIKAEASAEGRSA